MIAGLQGRVRVQGHPEVHDNNVRAARNPVNRDLVELERPIENMMRSINQSMSIRTQIALREERRRSYLFEQENPFHPVHYEDFNFDEELKEDDRM
jgi:hypothetical protein